MRISGRGFRKPLPLSAFRFLGDGAQLRTPSRHQWPAGSPVRTRSTDTYACRVPIGWLVDARFAHLTAGGCHCWRGPHAQDSPQWIVVLLTEDSPSGQCTLRDFSVHRMPLTYSRMSCPFGSWLDMKYPSCRSVMQNLSSNRGRPYFLVTASNDRYRGQFSSKSKACTFRQPPPERVSSMFSRILDTEYDLPKLCEKMRLSSNVFVRTSFESSRRYGYRFFHS